jgi:hypothetical protein
MSRRKGKQCESLNALREEIRLSAKVQGGHESVLKQYYAQDSNVMNEFASNMMDIGLDLDAISNELVSSRDDGSMDGIITGSFLLHSWMKCNRSSTMVKSNLKDSRWNKSTLDFWILDDKLNFPQVQPSSKPHKLKSEPKHSLENELHTSGYKCNMSTYGGESKNKYIRLYTAVVAIHEYSHPTRGGVNGAPDIRVIIIKGDSDIADDSSSHAFNFEAIVDNFYLDVNQIYFNGTQIISYQRPPSNSNENKMYLTDFGANQTVYVCLDEFEEILHYQKRGFTMNWTTFVQVNIQSLMRLTTDPSIKKHDIITARSNIVHHFSDLNNISMVVGNDAPIFDIIVQREDGKTYEILGKDMKNADYHWIDNYSLETWKVSVTFQTGTDKGAHIIPLDNYFLQCSSFEKRIIRSKELSQERKVITYEKSSTGLYADLHKIMRIPFPGHVDLEKFNSLLTTTKSILTGFVLMKIVADIEFSDSLVMNKKVANSWKDVDNDSCELWTSHDMYYNVANGLKSIGFSVQDRIHSKILATDHDEYIMFGKQIHDRLFKIRVSYNQHTYYMEQMKSSKKSNSTQNMDILRFYNLVSAQNIYYDGREICVDATIPDDYKILAFNSNSFETSLATPEQYLEDIYLIKSFENKGFEVEWQLIMTRYLACIYHECNNDSISLSIDEYKLKLKLSIAHDYDSITGKAKSMSHVVVGKINSEEGKSDILRSIDFAYKRDGSLIWSDYLTFIFSGDEWDSQVDLINFEQPLPLHADRCLTYIELGTLFRQINDFKDVNIPVLDTKDEHNEFHYNSYGFDQSLQTDRSTLRSVL